jgi:YD repeat-containing protein
LLVLKQADPSAGDGGKWIASGLPLRAANGRPYQFQRSWFTNVDPTASADVPVGIGSGAVAARVVYDAFGRPLRTYASDGTQLSQRDYHALAIDVQDAEDLSPSGPHAGTGVTLALDGHGRVNTLTRRLRQNGAMDNLQTLFVYQATGELSSIMRKHSLATDSTMRWLQCDSLGRLILNAEPNTSAGFTADPSGAAGMKAWRYSYDDSGRLVGTSDARGCGKNLFYDNADRLLAEDYSPCTAEQADYSPLTDPLSGDGAEVVYRYDVPEPDQTVANPSFANGRLVATLDRASHTRFAYDGRGRLTTVERRLARPVGLATMSHVAGGVSGRSLEQLWQLVATASAFALIGLAFQQPRRGRRWISVTATVALIGFVLAACGSVAGPRRSSASARAPSADTRPTGIASRWSTMKAIASCARPPEPMSPRCWAPSPTALSSPTTRRAASSRRSAAATAHC